MEEKIKVLTFAELVKATRDEQLAFMQNPVIGKISFNEELNTINIDTGHSGYIYEIDCERMTDKSEVLNWIFHIRQKTWMTHKMMGELIEMISKVLPIWSIIHD